ncbi:MAG: lipopolysaccharide biosynthesis protein [Chthoniobacterales bacterium]
MSRAGHFTRGLSASWLATFVTVAYSLASVPIALRHLDVEEFGLFMLMMQVAGYLTLIELGMSGASARILIDHKDASDRRAYAEILSTSALVCAAQAGLILLIGFAAAPVVPLLFSIPEPLHAVAGHLLRWLSLAFAIGTGLRIFSSVLYANRRIDLVNLLMSLVPLLGLLLMWLVLSAGGGLQWLPIAFIPPALVAGGLAAAACWRLGLLPRRGEWRAPAFNRFREMFALGRDIFLVNAGMQVLEASQLMIVSRSMGLGAAAIWSVSTKLFTLIFQLGTKIEASAVVFFSEMMARGEKDLLRLRFRQIYQLSASLAAASLAFAVAINREFVSVWAEPTLAWSTGAGTLLAVLTFVAVATRCQVDLIIHTKDIRALRYILLLEAAVFVLAALWAGRVFGFPGILATSLVCALAFRGSYATCRVARFLDVPAMTVGLRWLARPAVSFALMLGSATALAVWNPAAGAPPLTALAVQAGLAGVLCLAGLWAVGLTAELRGELLARTGLRRGQA